MAAIEEIRANIERLTRWAEEAEAQGDTRRAHFLRTRHIPSWTRRPEWQAHLRGERKPAESDMAFDASLFTRSTDMDAGYVAEASVLGLAPGSYPSSFEMDGWVFLADRAQRGRSDSGHGEIVAMHYRSASGRAFATILND